MTQPIPRSLAALALAPRHIDFDAWTDALEALAYQLVHVSVKGARQLELDRAANDAVTQALAQLMDHARTLGGTPRPVLVAKDGVRIIGYEKLAEARAKVQVLTRELELLRVQLVATSAAAAVQWEPQFDVMCAKQEELVMQFCHEIAGPRGEKGSPPDPVRLLEMAGALYEAERDAFAPAGPGVVQDA